MVEPTAMLPYLTLQALLALSISCFWSPFWELCCSFAGNPQRRRKNGTGRFRSGGNISKKPTRGPATMRTIKPGKAGVTSITADGEIELLFLCLWYKKSLSHQTVLVSGGTGLCWYWGYFFSGEEMSCPIFSMARSF